MTQSPNIREFPAAWDCDRSRLGIELITMQNEDRANKNGAMLLHAAAEGAGNTERLADTLESLISLPSPNDSSVLERMCLASSYICGKAIGEGRCGRWRYDAGKHEITARRRLDEQNQ